MYAMLSLDIYIACLQNAVLFLRRSFNYFNRWISKFYQCCNFNLYLL